MMNDQVGWEQENDIGRGSRERGDRGRGNRGRGDRDRSGRSGRGRKGDIENFIRDELLYGDPLKLLRRIESTREGAALIDKERSLGPGWETSVQQQLLGFLDSCRDPGDCKDLAIMMGIDQSNWICQCGNKNYWFRAECNRRQCRTPKPNEEEHRPYDPMYDSIASSFGPPLGRGRADYLDPNAGGMREPLGRERYEFMDSDRREPWDRYRPPRDEPGWEHRNEPRRRGSRRDINSTPTWTCPQCQNKNYSHRKFCNRPNCDEPRPAGGEPLSRWLSNGDWECGRCGNLNYSSRSVCNRKTCNNPAPIENQRTFRRDDRSALPRTLPNGNWICPKCGNSNYPSRVVCNIKSCKMPNPAKRKPGDWICPTCRNINWVDKKVCNKPGCNTARPKRDMRSGDWECPKCGNFNFAHREVCNKYSCDEKKPLETEEIFNDSNGDIGGDEMTQKRGRSDSEDEYPSKRPRIGGPPGSWICQDCSNLNYPSRTVCNRRTCGLPRPAIGDDLVEVQVQ